MRSSPIFQSLRRLALLFVFLLLSVISSAHRGKGKIRVGTGDLELIYRNDELDSVRVEYRVIAHREENSKHIIFSVPLRNGTIYTASNVDSLAVHYTGAQRNLVTTLALYNYISENIADPVARFITGCHAMKHYHNSHTYRVRLNYLEKEWLVYYEMGDSIIYAMQLKFYTKPGTRITGDYQTELWPYSWTHCE